MYSWIKDMKINNYVDLLNEVAENYDYSKCMVCDEKMIMEQLLDNLQYIKYIEEFKVALFVERSVYHKVAFFNHETDVFSWLFKIYNLIFFHALIINPEKGQGNQLKSEREAVQNSFELAYSYFSIVVDKSIEKFDKESVDKYFEKTREVSCITNDMNSYQVSQGDLVTFLQENGWSKELLFQRGIEKLLSQGYMSREDSKIKRDNTISKVERRKEYVLQHKTEILEGMFPISIHDVDCKVIALILTTKPNFYFFVKGNKSDDFISMEWIEFKDKVEHHKL